MQIKQLLGLCPSRKGEAWEEKWPINISQHLSQGHCAFLLEGVRILRRVLAQAAITKYHRLSSLHNRYLFLIVLEAIKFKINVLLGATSGKGPLPSLQMAVFFLGPHMNKGLKEHSEIRNKGTNSIHKDSALMA